MHTNSTIGSTIGATLGENAQRDSWFATGNPQLTTWHLFDRFFAFFPRTGDLAIISPLTHKALKMRMEGYQREKISECLEKEIEEDRSLGDECKRVKESLEQLDKIGMFDQSRALTSNEQRRAIRGLMRHQPRNLQILVTDACNLACRYCYEVARGFHTNARMMPEAMADEILVRFFRDAGGRRDLNINFFGGEPLLNFDLVKYIVSLAKRMAIEKGKRITFTMTTNLVLFTEEIGRFLCEERFNIMVSLDGEAEGHDANRVDKRGRRTHATVVSNVRRLLVLQREYGTRPLKLRATLTHGNSDGESVRLYLESLEPYQAVVGEAIPTVRDEEAGALDLEDIDNGYSRNHQRMAAFLSVLGAAGPEGLNLSQLRKEGFRDVCEQVRSVWEKLAPGQVQPSDACGPQLCGVCRNMQAVTPTGDIYPCHRYVGMESFRIGHVNKGLDRDRIERIYEEAHASFAAKCSRCWARSLCGGPCIWTTSKEDGTITTPPEKLCVPLRRTFQLGLAVLAVLGEEYPETLDEILGLGSLSRASVDMTAQN